jgi:hypothetical protein
MKPYLRALVFLVVCSSLSLAKDRVWITGTLVDSDTERGTRTVGIPSNIGSGPMITTRRNDLALYTIDDGKYLWVVGRRMTHKHDRPLDLTVNSPIKFDVENGDCFVLDDEGKEHKLEVEKKTLKLPGTRSN